MRYTTPAKAATATYAAFKKMSGLHFDETPLKSLLKDLDDTRKAGKAINDSLKELKTERDKIAVDSLYQTLRCAIGVLGSKGYGLYNKAEKVRYNLHPPQLRNLGVAGGVEAWRGFFQSLPKGWSVEVEKKTGKTPWFRLKVPVKPFKQKWKGVGITFTWIQINISITDKQDASFKIVFQPGKRHKGSAPSPHPHVDSSGLCEGAGGTGLSNAEKSWNIIGLYGLLHTVLITPNYGGHAFYQPEDFTNVPGGRCKTCGWWFPIEILRKGGKCSSCFCYICFKCVKKTEEEKAIVSRCPKCATAEKKKLRKLKKEKGAGKEEKKPLKCKECAERGLYFCESPQCSSKIPGRLHPKVICRDHSKKCGYCGRILCVSCQKKYKCKACKGHFCSSHLNKDSGCCDNNRCRETGEAELKEKMKVAKIPKVPAFKIEGDDNVTETFTSIPTAVDF